MDDGKAKTEGEVKKKIMQVHRRLAALVLEGIRKKLQKKKNRIRNQEAQEIRIDEFQDFHEKCKYCYF